MEALDHCRVMILIFSSYANQSKQIRREVQRAFDREVPVVPLRVEDVMPEKSLAYFMGPVHWLDALTPPFEKHLQKIVLSVLALVRALPVTTPPPVSASSSEDTPPPAPVYSQTVTGPAAPTAASIALTRPSVLWDLLDYTTAIFLSGGTALLAWWLTAASTGPSRFAQIAWMTRDPVGQLFLACYCLLILFHSLRGILMLIGPSHFGLANSTGTNLNFEDYANVANAPLVVAFAALMIQVSDGSHARVVSSFDSAVVTLPMLLFVLTVPVQMRASLRSIVDRHVSDNSLRPPFQLAITFLVARGPPLRCFTRSSELISRPRSSANLLRRAARSLARRRSTRSRCPPSREARRRRSRATGRSPRPRRAVPVGSSSRQAGSISCSWRKSGSRISEPSGPLTTLRGRHSVAELG